MRSNISSHFLMARSPSPVLLGRGERLFADVDGSEIELEQIRAVEAPGVTHISYRVKRGG